MTPGDSGIPDDNSYRLSRSPGHLLRRAQQFSSETFADAGLGDGITFRQSVVLAAVAEAEGSSQSDLVRATGVDRSTLADMIARMERRGLVQRRAADGDARAKAVWLTKQGRSALDDALPAMRAADAALLEALPKNRRKSFLDILSLLAGASEEDEAQSDEGGSKNEKKSKDKKKKKKKKKKDKA